MEEGKEEEDGRGGREQLTGSQIHKHCHFCTARNYDQRSSHVTAFKEKFQSLLTAVHGRCSWLLSTLGGPAHDRGRNSSLDPGVRREEDRDSVKC